MQYKRVVGMVPALEVDIGKARMVFGNSDTRVTELNARLAELMAKSGPTDEEEAKLQVCLCVCVALLSFSDTLLRCHKRHVL